MLPSIPLMHQQPHAVRCHLELHTLPRWPLCITLQKPSTRSCMPHTHASRTHHHECLVPHTPSELLLQSSTRAVNLGHDSALLSAELIPCCATPHPPSHGGRRPPQRPPTPRTRAVQCIGRLCRSPPPLAALKLPVTLLTQPTPRRRSCRGDLRSP